MLPKILCVVGTRPEVVKMAPVAFALRRSHKWDVRILATAQHREMLDQVMGMFDLVADLDLDAMRPNQALPNLTSRLMTGMDECLKEHQPQLVLAQGDTTTVLVLRDETERPEAVLEGVAELVGTDPQRIVNRVSTLLDDEDAYRKMARGSSPYGDGKAAERIVRCIDAFFQGRSRGRCG